MAQLEGTAKPEGSLAFQVVKNDPAKARAAGWEAFHWRVKNWLVQRWQEVPLECYLFLCFLASKIIPGANVPAHGRLYGKVIRGDGTTLDLGCVGVRLIVTAGRNFLAGCFDGTNEPEVLKYHGYGTGTTSPASNNTALETELTTQYAVNSTRPTGTQSVSSAVYTTVGTLTPDASVACTEWGLLSQAATGGGTLFDRQTFSVVNLASGDSFVTTYALTIS